MQATGLCVPDQKHYMYVEAKSGQQFQLTTLLYRTAGIYYKLFNFVNFANGKALAKIKARIYFWIHIHQTKCIASSYKFKNSK